ncbi:MAG: hypothetical protein K6G61_05790 [Solobacterium sp.]|nr:hypothetical protein [Solobacterium sp.]
MKNILKRMMIALTAVFMLCMTLTVPVQAKAAGTRNDPFVMTAGKVLHYTWDSDNSGSASAGIYNRFTIPADGCVKLTFTRPYDYNGYYSTYDITIKDDTGAKVIAFATESDDYYSDANLVYKVGLKQGTYLMHMKCNAEFYSYSSLPCDASYKYTFTETAFFETEPNNTKLTADPMKTGSVYTGAFGEEKKADFFSISLQKGIIYQLKLKGFADLDEHGAKLKLLSPSGTTKTLTKTGSTVSDTTRIWTFRPETAGRYYFSISGFTGAVPAAYKVSVVKAAANQLVTIDGIQYYTGSAGKVFTGWKQISSKWYYFEATGAAKGWRKISNKWYYFSKKGIMVTGWQKISDKWYYFNSSGVMVTGWQKIGKKWYYFSSKGIMTTGWKQLSGKWYYFDKDGVMVTGPQVIGKKVYNFSSSGAMQKGWLKDGDFWFYFGSDGAMVTKKKMTIGGKSYEFLNNGVMYDSALVYKAANALVGRTGSCEDMAYQLTKLAFGMGGMSLSALDPRLAHQVPFSEARAGDIIMYTYVATGGVPHVGVYLDGWTSFQGNWLQSDGTRKAVITDLRYSNYWNRPGYEAQFWRVDMDVLDNLDLVFDALKN